VNAETHTTDTYKISEVTVWERGQRFTHFEIKFRGQERGTGWTVEELAADFAARNQQYSRCEVSGDKLICTINWAHFAA